MQSFAKIALLSTLVGAAVASPVEIEKRDIQKKVLFTSNLMFNSTDGSYPNTWASFNGQRDGNNRQILVLKPNGQPAPPEQFKFVAVKSDKYKTNQYGFSEVLGNSGVVTSVGQLESVRTPGICITASALGQSNQRFVAAPCSNTDDDSQRTQNFYVESVPDFSKNLPQGFNYTTYITFADIASGGVSYSPNGPPSSPYSIRPGNTANVKVQLDYNSSSKDVFIAQDSLDCHSCSPKF